MSVPYEHLANTGAFVYTSNLEASPIKYHSHSHSGNKTLNYIKLLETFPGINMQK